jgi:hypothetical protein
VMFYDSVVKVVLVRNLALNLFIYIKWVYKVINSLFISVLVCLGVRNVIFIVDDAFCFLVNALVSAINVLMLLIKSNS